MAPLLEHVEDQLGPTIKTPFVRQREVPFTSSFMSRQSIEGSSKSDAGLPKR